MNKGESQHKKRKYRKRARGPHKKEQLEEILKKGREMAVKGGADFSINALAKELNMSPGNIYNYVDSKRELWFAMFNDDYYADVIQIVNQITTNRSTSIVEKISQVLEFFFTFASENYSRFKIMFATAPPPPKHKDAGPGEYERRQRPTALLSFIQAIDEAMRQNKLPPTNPGFFALLIFSLVSGAIHVDQLTKDDQTLHLGSEFFEFIIEEFQKMLMAYSS
ncbi:MAG: TetR/AcrR family transcriptional regulator [Candidatus Heimdallarchaeota archaeon]